MKMIDIKIGDLVKIHDGSYAVRVDKFEPYTGIGLSKDPFEVIHKQSSDHLGYNSGLTRGAHNIFIRNVVNGKIYLHSSGLVRLADPRKLVKELTVAEISKKLGYEVKIIK